MSTIKVTNIQSPDSGTNDIIIDASGNVDIGGFSADASAPVNSVNLDSSGRLLVGTSSSLDLDAPIQAASTTFAFQGLRYNTGATAAGGTLDLARSNNATVGTTTAVTAGQGLGIIRFRGAGDSSSFVSGAQIEAIVESGTISASSMPGRLVFSTTADGSDSPTERMRINSVGNLFCQGVYDNTTSSGANTFVNINGNLARSTSSIKYKTNVETLADQYADALMQCRPVWYRSKCEIDNPSWGYWGFIAEEVAEIDPRLVHWKTTEAVVQENGSIEHVPCKPEPEGVQYDRFVPHLLNLIKRQGEAIAELQAEVAALKAS